MNPTATALFLVFAPFFSAEQAECIALRYEIARFPNIKECDYWLERADLHIQWINNRMCLFPQDRYELWLYRQQVSRWVNIWVTLRGCHLNQEVYSLSYNRERLQRIREAIGEWNYAFGVVPPPIASYFLTSGFAQP